MFLQRHKVAVKTLIHEICIMDSSYSVCETQTGGTAMEVAVVQGQPGLHENRSQTAEVRPVSLNLPEQLHWDRRGHIKVKSEQLRKCSLPRPFPEGFVGQAAQRKATTHDWPARLRGRDTAGAVRETHVRLPIGPLRAGKRAGQAKQDFRVRLERRAATLEDDWSFPSRGGALGFWIGPI